MQETAALILCKDTQIILDIIVSEITMIALMGGTYLMEVVMEMAVIVQQISGNTKLMIIIININ